MAYIIDDTFFIDYIDIPNKDEMNSKSLGELNRRIDEKGALLVRDAIGQANKSELDTHLVAGVLPTTGVPQKWINLVYGCTYTVNDVDKYWKGLIQVEGSYKGSVIADFVFYHYLVQNITYVSGVGEVRADAKNAPAANSTQRAITVWNEDFLLKYQGNWRYSGQFEPKFWFVGWNWNDWGYWNGDAQNDDVSLLQFLSENETDYPDARRKSYAVQNQLGL